MGVTLIPGLTKTQMLQQSQLKEAANATTAAQAAAASTNTSPADALAQTGYPADFGDAVSPYPGAPATIDEIQTVTQNPLKLFGADILLPGAGVITTIDIWEQMGPNCVGFNIIGLSLPALVNINGGGFRTVPSDMVLDGSIIKTLVIQNFGINAVCQLNGV